MMFDGQKLGLPDIPHPSDLRLQDVDPPGARPRSARERSAPASARAGTRAGRHGPPETSTASTASTANDAKDAKKSVRPEP